MFVKKNWFPKSLKSLKRPFMENVKGEVTLKVRVIKSNPLIVGNPVSCVKSARYRVNKLLGL